MSTAALLKPLALGPITLRNRVIMSALTRSRSVPTNVPNDLNVEYYKQRAKGGAGLITTEGTLISQQGTEWQNAPGIWSKEHVNAWKKVTDAVHSEGGHIFVQLWHLGRMNHPDAPEQRASGLPVYAPSAIAARGGKFRFIEGVPGYVTPTAVEDPQTLVELFRKAAVNAKEAGFDGAEVHGANGYLITQFLDSTSNKRTDKWGGSAENRARFALETLKVVIEVFGADRVGLRLSPCGGYNDVGMPLEETKETFSYLISEADKLKIAYITLIRYNEMMDVEFDGKKRGIPHDVVEAYGPLIKNAKFFLNSGLTADEGARLIEAGKIDGAVYGMNWITHPDFAHRIRDGKPLNNAPDYANLYGHGGSLEQERKGYVDYPFAE